jgi:hypothetical protein
MVLQNKRFSEVIILAQNMTHSKYVYQENGAAAKMGQFHLSIKEKLLFTGVAGSKTSFI